jgi:hypothetical protein
MAGKAAKKKAARKKAGAKRGKWGRRAPLPARSKQRAWTTSLLKNLMDEGYSRTAARELVDLAKS